MLAHPRMSVGCPYTGPIRGHRVRQRSPGSLRFFTHVIGRDGVGNAWKVNRTLEVGGSTPLGSTLFSPSWRSPSSAAVFSCRCSVGLLAPLDASQRAHHPGSPW